MRNLIYTFALVNEDSIPIQNIRPFITEPPLLDTCKQVRGEGLAQFYGANTFQSPDLITTERFLNEFERDRLSLIRSLRAMSAEDLQTLSKVVGMELAKGLLTRSITYNSPAHLMLLTIEKNARAKQALVSHLFDLARKNKVADSTILVPERTSSSDEDLEWVPATVVQARCGEIIKDIADGDVL